MWAECVFGYQWLDTRGVAQWVFSCPTPQRWLRVDGFALYRVQCVACFQFSPFQGWWEEGGRNGGVLGKGPLAGSPLLASCSEG